MVGEARLHGQVGDWTSMPAAVRSRRTQLERQADDVVVGALDRRDQRAALALDAVGTGLVQRLPVAT